MRGYLIVCIASVTLGSVGLPARAVAQTPAPPVAVADPAYDAAKKAFDLLPENDRRGIQNALIWTGDYKGVVDGGFGRATRAAILTYAKRSGLPPDGTLDAPARAGLLATANTARTAAGFAPVRDEKSGVVISLPQKILIKRVDGKTGSRWVSGDGAASLETTQVRESDGDLATYFDKLKDSTPTRRVTYKVSRPDFFVVSGTAGAAAFYTRMARGAVDGESMLRGYTMTFPAGAKNLENMVVAVANSFDPFPAPASASGRVAAVAKSTPTTTTAPPDAPPPPVAARKPSLSASAINLGGGRAISALGACEAPQIAGHAAKLLTRDEKSGAVIFEATGLGGQGLSAQGPTATPEAGEQVLVLFQAAAQGDATELLLAPGQILPGGVRILAPLAETAVGAAVFDRKGVLLGMIGARAAPRSIAGVTPQAAWPLIPANAASDLAHSIVLVAGPNPANPAAADIAARAKVAILPVTCLK